MKPSRANLLDTAAESLDDALSATANEYNAGTFSLTLQAEPRKQMNPSVKNFVRNLLRRSTNPQDDFETLKIKGFSSESDRTETFDLLKDQLIFKREITKVSGKTRGVDSESMFSAIQKAYNDHKDELMSATALGLIE